MSQSLTVLTVVSPEINITVPELLLSEFQDSLAIGGIDVFNIMLQMFAHDT